MTTAQALHVLQHTFGYSEFRDRQAEIIDTVTQANNALVVMPTGGGKSLCYQIPSLIRDGTGVVVSPLIALMQDQVSALKAHGVNAVYLNSTLPPQEVIHIEQALRSGDVDLLYIAPERLLQPRSLELLAQIQLSLFAIDEAHCVAQWGHDFRSDYLRLEILASQFPSVPRIALTATADTRTQREIIQRLDLDKNAQFICGFDRINIQYHIKPKHNPRKQLLRFLREDQAGNSGIIYCLSRNKVEDIADWLSCEGFDALPYHAGMDAKRRQRHQGRFLREENIIIVATIAFGMGIDKPNVRFVVHMDMPKSVEAYYQETGRAGRDGEPATAVLYYGMEDVVKLSQMVANSEGNENFKRHENQRLNSMLGLCEMTTCRRQALLRYFGEVLEVPCGNCDNCLVPPNTWDATEEVQKALSCVYRTRQRFGAAHVIDVLRGRDTAKIRQFSHQRLSTYGIGKDFAAETWRSVFRQLLVMGYLQVDAAGYGSLQLTEKCRSVLRGQESVSLRREAKAGSKRAPKKILEDIAEEDQGLWEALRQCRKTLAEQGGVPPYVIFGDASLREMLVKRPLTSVEFLRVNGVGDKKLELYGESFLELIREYEYDKDYVEGKMTQMKRTPLFE